MLLFGKAAYWLVGALVTRAVVEKRRELRITEGYDPSFLETLTGLAYDASAAVSDQVRDGLARANRVRQVQQQLRALHGQQLRLAAEAHRHDAEGQFHEVSQQHAPASAVSVGTPWAVDAFPALRVRPRPAT